jgi:hypothetical protein
MLAAILLLATVEAGTLIPPSPTTRDTIVYRIGVDCPGFQLASMTRVGNAITIHLQGPEGCLAILDTVDVPLGPLPAGNYTIVTNIIDFNGNVDFYEDFAFAVNAAAVPALSLPQLLALTASLGAAGALVLRARSG